MTDCVAGEGALEAKVTFNVKREVRPVTSHFFLLLQFWGFAGSSECVINATTTTTITSVELLMSYSRVRSSSYVPARERRWRMSPTRSVPANFIRIFIAFLLLLSLARSLAVRLIVTVLTARRGAVRLPGGGLSSRLVKGLMGRCLGRLLDEVGLVLARELHGFGLTKEVEGGLQGGFPQGRGRRDDLRCGGHIGRYSAVKGIDRELKRRRGRR